jgi:hypothetical protein
MKKRKSESRRASPIRPVRPLQQNLPLLDENLGWERFEEFCRDFVSRLPGVDHVTSYGRKGSKQKGIDFPATMESGETWSFQCRQVKRFTHTAFEKLIKADTYGADRHVVLLASQAGSELRDTERANPTWQIWDVTDISRTVRQLSAQDQRALLVAHFGPYVQETFLGLRGSASFRTWHEQFAPYLRPGRIFHHLTPLVGRVDVLSGLNRFLDQAATRIAVVPGRGGIGKTRVLVAFGQDLIAHHPERNLLYADEATAFSPDSLQDIPAEATTLVVDDAHRRDDLGELLSFIARWPHPVHLVMTIRPEGRDRLSAVLAESAFDAGEVKWFSDLQALPREEAEGLASAALGKELDHLAERLFAATWDCPLVTIVGAELLRRKQVAPELLAKDVDFRRAVLDKFSDAALGQLGDSVDSRTAARLLELISAIQPIRFDDGRWVDAAASFLEIPVDQVRRTLGALEETGLLLRRGYQLRIVPDVLADHLLARASLTSEGEATGYVDRILEQFQGLAFDRLLANTAELDWRVQMMGGSATRLLDQAWALFDTEFRVGSNTQQVALLRLIKDAAVFQPGRVLDLVEWSIDHPSTVEEQPDGRFFLRQGRSDVLHVLAELAVRCAYGGHVRRSAVLLWRLGRDDARPMNQHPNHPVRLLAELAGYDLGKPLYVSEAVFDAAVGWLALPDAHDYVRSPLDVLDALLAKKILNRSSDGISVTLRSVSINAISTRPLRDRVLSELEKILRDGTAKAAVRGVTSLDHALRDPLPYFGQTIDSAEKVAWEDEQSRSLDILAIGMDRADAPLVQLAVAETVAWTATHSYSPRLRERAQAIWGSVPESFELRVARALTHPWGRESDVLGSRDLDEIERLRTERMRRTADELAGFAPTGDELLNFLQAQASRARAANVSQDAGYLVGLLSERHPSLAMEAAQAIVAVPGHPLEYMLPQFLLGARLYDPERAVDAALAATRGGSKLAAANVAHMYAHQLWRDADLSGDLDVLLELLKSEDDVTLAMAISGLGSLRSLSDEDGKKLILATRVGRSAEIGEALAQLLDSKVPSIYAAMSESERTILVDKLQEVESLDGYHVRRFLRALAVSSPMAVLRLLIRRIDSLEARHQDIALQVVPHNWAGEAIWNEIPANTRRELLIAIRDASTGEGWPRRVELPELYADVAAVDWIGAAEVLEEWIHSRDSRLVQAAVHLFSRAPADFVFEHPEVVERALDAAATLGEDVAQASRVAFASSARTGIRTGRVLQPAAGDVDLRNRAREYAERYAVETPTRIFYENLAADTDAMIAHMRKLDEELIGGPLP